VLNKQSLKLFRSPKDSDQSSRPLRQKCATDVPSGINALKNILSQLLLQKTQQKIWLFLWVN